VFACLREYTWQFAIMANHRPLLYQLLDNPKGLLDLDDRQFLNTTDNADVITHSLHYALLKNKAKVLYSK
jgi:hypothetical protein